LNRIVMSHNNELLLARGITFIMQAIIFRIVPTALEISLVCGILVRHPEFRNETGVRNKTFRRTNLVGILLPSPR